jgi:exodeoxyribonuclease V alpha subunit
LEPAFACTIHKAQGCEFPVAIVPVHRDYERVLQRNLLYTGITRGAKLTILVGDMNVVDTAVLKTDANLRRSLLKKRLVEKFD